MKRYRSVPFFALTLAVITVLSLGLAACGSSSGSSATNSPAAAASGSAAAGSAAALVPADMASAGVIKVGTTFDFPPMESYAEDGTTPVGMEVELMQGVADALGLKLEWVNMNWDGLRPALQSGRFDAVMAAMGDFTDRQQQVTFVDYLNSSEAVLVKKADAASITKVEDLAGKTIGGARGTLAVTGAEALNKTFEAQGLAPMKLSVFQTDSEGVLGVQSGRVFGHIMDTPVVMYKAQTAGNGETFAGVLPGLIPGFPYGVAVRKDATPLANAIKAAFDQMIKDGSYGQIMTKYGTVDNALPEAIINGGKTSSGA